MLSGVPPTLLAVRDLGRPASGGPAWSRRAVEALRTAAAGRPGAVVEVDYAAVAAGRLPAGLLAPTVALFFPYAFWDARVEGRMPGPYGSAAASRALEIELTCVDAHLRRRYGDHLCYLNPPAAVATTRDKARVRAALIAAGVPVPPPVPADLLRATLDAGRRVYSKAVCGSMNKGITVLRRDRVTSNHDLLTAARAGVAAGDRHEVLLFDDLGAPADWMLDRLALAAGRGDVVLEEGVDAGLPGGTRADLRVTVLDGRVDRLETALAPAGSPTAGAPVQTGPALGCAVLSRAGEVSIAAAAALGLRYAVLDVVVGAADGDGDRSVFVVDAQAFPASDIQVSTWRAVMTGHEPPWPATLSHERSRTCRV